MNIPVITHLTNSVLKVRLEDLRGKEREAIAELVLHLAEIIRRGYYRDLGYSSIYSYMKEGLGYSEPSAHIRISAAKCLETNPEIYFMLRDGRVNLSSLSEVRKAPVAEQKALLTQVEGKSRRDIQVMVAMVSPIEALKKESVRVRRVAVKALPIEVPTTQRSWEIEQRYSITLDADKEFIELLEKASLLAGTKKNLEVLRKALDLLVAKKTAKPRVVRKQPADNSRYIPAEVKAAVYKRDGHQCTFECNGKRCTEKHYLQIEHCLPYALGGTNDESNLRLLCRTHNRLMAERIYGRSKIQQFAQSSP